MSINESKISKLNEQGLLHATGPTCIPFYLTPDPQGDDDYDISHLIPQPRETATNSMRHACANRATISDMS